MKKKLVCVLLTLAIASILVLTVSASPRNDGLLLLEEAAMDASITVEELRETQRIVSDIVFEQRDCAYSYNVSFTSIDPLINRIVIGIVEYNCEMIAGFRRHVYDSPLLTFVQSDRIDMGAGHGTCFFTIMGIIVFLIMPIGVIIIIKMRRGRDMAHSIPSSSIKSSFKISRATAAMALAFVFAFLFL